MNMNFSLAFAKLGVAPSNRRTVFRYDDTNPDAESKEYIDSLRRDVSWLGWVPECTTYSSDNFVRLHACAVALINKGLAYVDFMTKATVERQRDHAKRRAAIRARGGDIEAECPVDASLLPGPYRESRTAAENLKLFDDMKNGKFKEGECTLRLKMDFDSPNPNMHDLVAYRIKYTTHQHSGDGWCIYPSYDFTHGLCDSFEHIDYSICTLEFETRREPYFWILWALDAYRPKVFEMSRLNIAYTVLSKRRLLHLVNNGVVRGWDDPRMPTISGLRRRGYTKDCINDFCNDIGATRNQNLVEVSKFQHYARLSMQDTARRCMAVLAPLKVAIVNYGEFGPIQENLAVPDLPQFPERGSHPLKFGSVVHIDETDFREHADDNFFGLTANMDGSRLVGLKYANVKVYCVGVERDAETGAVVQLNCKVAPPDSPIKPKTYITWVGPEAVKVEVRLYDHLFTVPEPSDQWEQELNPKSEVVKADALIDGSILAICDKSNIDRWKSNTSFQFERLGYFVLDSDTTYDHASSSGGVVFNSVVSLREDVARVVVVVDAPEAGSGGATAATAAAAAAPDPKSKEGAAAAQRAKAAEREALLKIPAKEFFRQADEFKGKFSKYDEEGFPTHDAEGVEITKSGKKKLTKDLEKHVKMLEGAAKK